MTTIKANGRDLELKTDQDIALYPTNNIWISQGTKLIFEGTIPDDFEVKLQATSVTADRDLILPDSDGTIATQEWANAQGFGGGGGGSLNNVVEDTTPELGGSLVTAGNRITHAASGNVSHLNFTTTQFGVINQTVLSSVKDINFFLDSNGGDSSCGFRIYNNVDPDNLGATAESDYIFKVSENGDVNITGDIVTNSAGTPTITSSTDIALTAGTGATNKVEVTQSPFKLANLTDAQRDALTAENGYMIYNTDDNRFQAYQNGAWVRLDFSAIV